MWTKIIPSKVFTRLKNEGKKRIENTYDSYEKKFKSPNFTDTDRSTSTTKFPTIYLKKMQGKAIGRTLEDTKVNGITSTFQIEVTTNTKQNDSEIIADVLADLMIEMGYEMIGDPVPDNTGDVYRNISRWQRTIGYNDKLNF